MPPAGSSDACQALLSPLRQKCHLTRQYEPSVCSPNCGKHPWSTAQVREGQLQEHETGLAAWKHQINEDGRRQMEEQEAALSERAGKLDARSRELSEQQKTCQVQPHIILHVMLPCGLLCLSIQPRRQ